MRIRALDKNERQVSSIVGLDSYRVCITSMLYSSAAAASDR